MIAPINSNCLKLNKFRRNSWFQWILHLFELNNKTHRWWRGQISMLKDFNWLRSNEKYWKWFPVLIYPLDDGFIESKIRILYKSVLFVSNSEDPEFSKCYQTITRFFELIPNADMKKSNIIGLHEFLMLVL